MERVGRPHVRIFDPDPGPRGSGPSINPFRFVASWRDAFHGVRFSIPIRPAWKRALQESVPPCPFPSDIMPPQFAHVPLIGPILGPCNPTRPDRIGAHIGPLFTVAFPAAQLPVPIIPLPNQGRSVWSGRRGSRRSKTRGGIGATRSMQNRRRGGPGSTRAVRSAKRSKPFSHPDHQAFPIGHPFGQRGIIVTSRRAKQMHVVRHDHVTPNPPIARVCPGGEERLVHTRIGQNRAAILRADRHEHQDRLVS